MECERWRDAISVMIDGEVAEIEPALVDAHVSHCAECRAFREAHTDLRRRVRIHAVEQAPDLAPRIVKAIAVEDRRSAWGAVRLALAAVGLYILAFAFPGLILGADAHASAHEARHLGAFTAAYGITLLVVAARPARARTVIPVAGFVAAAVLLTAGIDVANGDTPLIGEAVHVPEIFSVLLVWLLARPTPSRAPAQRPTRPGLRLVDDTAAGKQRSVKKVV